jgi:membrane-bound ClpP family serine protease
MTPALFILTLVGAALALLVLELFLPSHGLLGLFGLVCLGVAIGRCFWVNQWLGIGALLGALGLAPFAFAGAMKMWPRTPLGKRLVLKPVDGSITRPPVAVGQRGVALSELRPMGTADFGGATVEVSSEMGTIAPRTPVKVVAFENNRPVVAAV